MQHLQRAGAGHNPGQAAAKAANAHFQTINALDPLVRFVALARAHLSDDWHRGTVEPASARPGRRRRRAFTPLGDGDSLEGRRGMTLTRLRSCLTR